MQILAYADGQAVATPNASPIPTMVAPGLTVGGLLPAWYKTKAGTQMQEQKKALLAACRPQHNCRCALLGADTAPATYWHMLRCSEKMPVLEPAAPAEVACGAYSAVLGVHI
jgi:hypothetical protein